MAEYIEREAAEDAVGEAHLKGLNPLWELRDVPAADVAPVVHGRWGTGRFNPETGNYEEQCTRCRNFSKEYDKPYCPNCGAKMDNAESVQGLHLYFHKENKTCQSKKCATYGDGKVSWIDRLFCSPRKINSTPEYHKVPKSINIAKGCCQRCIENGGFRCKDGEICLTIGYTTIYLCKEHFCEAIKVLNDFYEKNKDEWEQKNEGADNG